MNSKSLILAIVSFLLVVVSCSVENDTIMNDMDKEMSTAGNKEAYLAFNLSGMTTKAGTQEAEAEEAAITSCSVIVARENNTISAVIDDVEVIGNSLQAKMLVKAEKNMKVVIIANSTKKFANCASLEQVYATTQEEADLNKFVKMGETTISAFEYTSTSTTDAINNPNNIHVSLQQLSARIELGKVEVVGFANGTNATSVTLEKMELLNANNTCLTNVQNNFKVEGFTMKETAVGSTLDGIGTFKFATIPALYSFPNYGQAENNQLSVKLTFKVGGNTVERIYVINDGAVKSGYLYRLNLKLRLASDSVDSTISFEIQNWKVQSYDVDMTAK